MQTTVQEIAITQTLKNGYTETEPCLFLYPDRD